MKKLLSFLAIGALVFGMASCGDGSNSSESNAPALKNFKVQVKDLTETSLTLEIEALIPDKYFSFDFVTAEAFAKNGADFYFKKAIAQIEEEHMLPEELFSKNKVSTPEQIEQGTDYVLCLFYVTDDLELDGEIEYTIIDTKGVAPKTEVNQATDNFTFAVSGITNVAAHIKIEPKGGKDVTYLYFLAPKTYLSQIQNFQELPYPWSSFVDGGKGTVEIDVNADGILIPNTEMVLGAILVNEKDEPAGSVEYIVFKTFDYKDALAQVLVNAYFANFSSYFIISDMGEPGEQTYFKIKTHNGEMTGTFTEKDFSQVGEDLEWQLLKGKAVLTAEFTGKKEGNDTYSYEGWCGCHDGFRYRMKIACVPPPAED